MAKILSVELFSIPEVINVGDEINDVEVEAKIEFHPLDISMQMEYCVHLLVYDVHGDVDTPFVLPNWDESQVIPISMSSKDEFLGEDTVFVRANEENKTVTIRTKLALKLGKVNTMINHTTRKLEAFATMAPAIGRSSRWSKPIVAQIMY